MRSLSRYILFIFITSLTLLSSCHKDDPAPPVETKTAILVYAVASNSLSGDFQNDRAEMIAGLSNVNLKEVDYYLYSIDKSSSDTNPPTLAKAVKNENGLVSFNTVKTYDRNTFSTDPERISQVISDFSHASTAPVRGLFLWSHAASWVPAYSSHVVTRSASSEQSEQSEDESHLVKVDQPDLKWFGQDVNGSQQDFCDIIELADALPDHYFDFIWWDCCYMSSIEVAYQFRNKSPMMVAYPTEVMAEGAPYNLILPFIAKDSPNLIAAAATMSDDYERRGRAYTIAVLDLTQIEPIADMARQAVPGTRLYQPYLLKYSRGGYRFYDFGQYTRTWGESLGDTWDSNRFNSLMDKFVVYKNSSDILINNYAVDEDSFYGISTHYINLDFDPEWASPDSPDLYYLKLDWYHRVFDN